jgi:hypothetical protein
MRLAAIAMTFGADCSEDEHSDLGQVPRLGSSTIIAQNFTFAIKKPPLLDVKREAQNVKRDLSYFCCDLPNGEEYATVKVGSSLKRLVRELFATTERVITRHAPCDRDG